MVTTTTKNTEEKKPSRSQLKRLARIMLEALREEAGVYEKDPKDVLVADPELGTLEALAPLESAQFLQAALQSSDSEFAALANVSASLAALSLAG